MAGRCKPWNSIGNYEKARQAERIRLYERTRAELNRQKIGYVTLARSISYSADYTRVAMGRLARGLYVSDGFEEALEEFLTKGDD